MPIDPKMKTGDIISEFHNGKTFRKTKKKFGKKKADKQAIAVALETKRRSRRGKRA